MPAQERLGLHEESPQVTSAEQPAESGEKGTISRTQCGTLHLSAEHRHLVSEHDDLDSQFGGVPLPEAEQLEEPDRSDIDERQGHRPFPMPPPTSESRRSTARMEFSAPTGQEPFCGGM